MPFFHHAVRTYEGYTLGSGAAAPPISPTPSGTPNPANAYDPPNPIYPLPFVPVDSSGNPLDPSKCDSTIKCATRSDGVPGPGVGPQCCGTLDQLKKAISSNLTALPTPNSTCPSPAPLTSDQIFQTAGDIATKLGINQSACTKKQSNQAKQQSTSGSFTQEASLGWFASESVTGAAQNSSSQNDQQNSEKGCGSSIINAVNVSNKQSQMQCIINNVTQNTTGRISITEGISITTAKLTPKEVEAFTALQIQNAADLLKLETQCATMVNGAMVQLAMSPAITQDKYNTAIKALQDFNTNIIEIMSKSHAAAEAMYSRDITTKNLKISLSGNAQMKASITLSSEAKSTLSTLAASVSKDVTSQALANTFGTSVLDPSVQEAASSATQNNSASASSSITNILSSTKLDINESGSLEINCPGGSITLIDTTIDQNFVATLIVNAVLSQSVTNGMTAATNFLSDSSNTQGVINKVAGLDDLQNALNAGIVGAINAGNAPVMAAVSANSIKYIIGAIVGLAVLFLLYKLFAGGSDNKNSGPLITPELINAAANAYRR